jgi:hypothetical protein
VNDWWFERFSIKIAIKISSNVFPFFLDLTQMFTKGILIVLTTLNISIQAMDCNNLKNSFVLRILFVLCFWGEGDWLGVREGGGDETFHFL